MADNDNSKNEHVYGTGLFLFRPRL